MDELAGQAAAQAARSKANRAAGLLRDLGHDLAQLASGLDTLGVLRVHDGQSAMAAKQLIDLGLSKHGAVDVVVIARPIRRTPTKARRAKENHHASNTTAAR